MVYAIDFDGTLCVDRYPEIGEPREDVINALLAIKGRTSRRTAQDRFILWTCREGDQLERALQWCYFHGLTFDAVNDNLPEHIERYGNNCRKVYADIYIDDRNASDVLGVEI